MALAAEVSRSVGDPRRASSRFVARDSTRLLASDLVGRQLKESLKGLSSEEEVLSLWHELDTPSTARDDAELQPGSADDLHYSLLN